MMVKTIETEIAIVGSGTAGATLAKELSKRGKKVLLVEKGKKEVRLGSMKDALRFYEKRTFRKSKEGMPLYGTSMVGGTSLVASGNAVRCLEKELLGFGINLEKEFKEAEEELKAAPLPDKCISEGARKIIEAAERLGLGPKRIPKFINPAKCVGCGNCVLGCRYNAKWSALAFVEEASRDGLTLLTGTKVKKVLVKNKKACGLFATQADGSLLEIKADKVIIAAGGIETPVILQQSGITNAGKKMFCDPFMTTYAMTKNINQTKGVNAPAYIRKPGRFIAFPFIDPPVQFLLYTHWRSLLGRLQRDRVLGVMTKIGDESIGTVDARGVIAKTISHNDQEKLDEGIKVVKEIFIKAGAEKKSIFTIKQVRGPHPGGTAAIGEVVNRSLETEIKDLFVCDNSVLPKAPGLPPILTLIALSKWLSGRLTA